MPVIPPRPAVGILMNALSNMIEPLYGAIPAQAMLLAPNASTVDAVIIPTPAMDHIQWQVHYEDFGMWWDLDTYNNEQCEQAFKHGYDGIEYTYEWENKGPQQYIVTFATMTVKNAATEFSRNIRRVMIL